MLQVTVGSHYLQQDERRLDAMYYTHALRVPWNLQQLGWPTRPLREFVEFTYLGRFKRHYVDSKKGVPFFGGRDIFSYPPKTDKFLHPDSVTDDLFVQEKDVLITCSGTVGHAILAGRSFRGKAVSQHVLRLRVKAEDEVGYIYAFVRSKYGYDFAQGSQFGAVIKELEPRHLAPLPVPILPESFRKRIHSKIMRALSLRERGVCLFQKAEHMLYTELGLPNAEHLEPVHLSLSPGKKLRAFTVSSRDLEGRLDGSYHLPEVASVSKALKHAAYPAYELGSLAEYVTIPSRFKRHYVNADIGIPFVRPLDLPMVRTLERHYIAKWTPELPELRLHRGEILVSTDGSIGDLSYVTDAWDGWAGSNNIGRIKVDESRLHPGYALAFLASFYGQVQLKREIYGGVIDHLEVSHIERVRIPCPPLDLQAKIGDRVLKAYALRDQANALEEEAIAELERTLRLEVRPRPV